MKKINIATKTHSFQKPFILIALLIALAVVAINMDPPEVDAASPATVVELDTSAAPILVGAWQVIRNGPGDQTDPHIDCDLVSYTDDDLQGTSRIRYYDFSTNTHQLVPDGVADSRSDVSGGNIVFVQATSQGSAPGPHVVIFDIETQTRAVFGGVTSPSIGGTLLSFDDGKPSNPNPSEVGAYELGVGVVARLSNDSVFDRNAVVSPDGNAIVWEKCQTEVTGCDVYAATRTGPTAFNTVALTEVEGEDRNPMTNGQVAVYTSTRNGETDIYFQPLAGGTETRLSIPGVQRNPRISGSLIAFQSPVENWDEDIFVYDISDGKIYRATDTLANETLGDMSMCNGNARIVFSAQSSDLDVLAFTFQPSSSTTDQVNDLVETVESFDLPEGIQNSLRTKLEEVLAAIKASDTATACDSLTAFINATQAQSDKKIPADQASQLITLASQIKTELGCQ